MKVLAIETSCEHASVALLLGKATHERRLEGHANHSEYLLPTLQALLAEAQVSMGSLDAIAFGAGPGAFTGLRLACGVTQGLAMGAGLGVVPVCSLAALSMQPAAQRVFVATDARMGEAYSAAFRRDELGLPVQMSPLICVPPEGLAFPDEGPWSAIGSALGTYADRIDETLRRCAAGWHPDAAPRAADVARIAAHELSLGHAIAPECATPLYVRDKVALTTAERLARGGRS